MMPMILNIETYMPYMDGLDMPHEQKVETIRTVWGIMEASVDQAFGNHPIQQARGYIETSDLHEHGRCLDSNNFSAVMHFDLASKKAVNEEDYNAKRKVGEND